MKNQRRYGGYIVHIGMAIIAIGVISSNAYSEEMMKTVNKGESFQVGNYELTFQELTETDKNGNGIVTANMDVLYKGKSNGTILPEKIFYGTWPEPSSEVAIKTNWKEDLYVVLSSWESKEKVTFVVKINPFVSWIWAGGILMMIGTAIALIGGKTSASYRIGSRKAGVRA
ncbi:cytochrome c-type biogenesis CcmF C-terminal domain-containing protein [Cytobacillus sp. FJAT-53684]|uniref:Cytochrome c-type biogenesis CcmF C-terminal domain-containing protein n=1 Tax=Cytobacillus mangrovibacter TaxID=3299024 RepID=A0ABW6K5G7_9BACI